MTTSSQRVTVSVSLMILANCLNRSSVAFRQGNVPAYLLKDMVNVNVSNGALYRTVKYLLYCSLATCHTPV